MTRIVRTALAVLVGFLALLPAATAHAATGSTTISFAATLPSVSNNTQTYGDLQYGTIAYQGTTLINGEEVVVRRDSVLDYLNGSGPIGGFLTVTWKDGSRLSMRVAGSSVNTSDGPNFTASLAVFSATGRWSGDAGAGVMRGSRKGPIGTPATYTYRITLTPRS